VRSRAVAQSACRAFEDGIVLGRADREKSGRGIVGERTQHGRDGECERRRQHFSRTSASSQKEQSSAQQGDRRRLRNGDYPDGNSGVAGRAEGRAAQHIQLAGLILAEPLDEQVEFPIVQTDNQLVNLPCGKIRIEETASGVLEAPGEVSEDVLALELWDGGPVVDEPTEDRDSFVVVVLEDRIDQVRRQAAQVIGDGSVGADEIEVAFLVAPAVVLAFLDAIDFLNAVLADVGNEELVAVETESERIAKSGRVDFRHRAALREWIVGGDAVFPVGGVRAVDVDSQDLAEDSGVVLGVADERIVAVVVVATAVVIGAASVAQRDVQIAIRPEREHSAVVVGLRLVDAEDRVARCGINPVRVVGVNQPGGDDALVIHRLTRVQGNRVVSGTGHGLAGVGENASVPRTGRVDKVRVERQPQQASLVVAGVEAHELAAQVKKRVILQRAILEEPNLAGLVQDEQPAAAVARADCQVGRRQA